MGPRPSRPRCRRVGGLITASFTLGANAVRRVTFTTEVQGLSGDDLAQRLVIGVRGQGVVTATQALVRTPRVVARGTADTHGGRVTSTDGRVTTLAKTASAGDLYALHSDHLGSVSLATDASGAPVANSLARYFPFRAERGAVASGSPTHYAFNGADLVFQAKNSDGTLRTLL